MNSARLGQVVLVCGALCAMPASAADLYPHDGWSSLAADRYAHKVGDTLTILVYESSAATNAANTGSNRSSTFGGHIGAGSSLDESASLTLGSSSDDSGETGRSGGMVAQISAVVDKVLPNGDLHVTGAQVMHINGERTEIRIQGRVRPADISPSNVVVSNRLADAVIDYDGNGFVSRAARPGLLSRALNWLGLP
jgi:flagellar L-ring protein precursor FlgH